MVTFKPNKLIELFLLVLLVIFPFSFERLTMKWDVLLLLILFFLTFIQLKKKYENIGKPTAISVITIVFLFLFDSSEKVNFIQLFNIRNPIGCRIPLSTIVLSIAIFFFMVELFMKKKIVFNIQTGIKYVLISFICVFILVVLFFPFLNFYYRMNIELDAKLINRILKFLAIIVLIQFYVKEEVQVRRYNLGLILSISTALILNIILKIIL